MTREEANITIDYLKEMQEGYIEGEGYERHPLPEWYALDKAIQTIEQTTWIPVSEKLPDFIINNTVSEDVLVFDGVDIRVGEYRKGCYMNGAGYWRVYGYDLEEYVDVIAWMPLPTPYDPQESEDTDANNKIIHSMG